jgi:hypothetical protein
MVSSQGALSTSALLLLGCVVCRDKPRFSQESAPASAAASRPAGSYKARAFLLEAAARRAPAGEPDIQDITIEFEAETDLEEHHEFNAEHRYLRPSYVWTRLTTSTSDVVRGFDGKTHWIQDRGKVTRLEGREFARDRNEVESSIRFTQNLVRTLSLRALAEQLTDLATIAPTEKDPRPGVRGNLAEFVSIRSREARPTHLELRFDPKTLDLVEVRAIPFEVLPGSAPSSPRMTETIELSDYREVGGTRFPFRIVAYTLRRDRPEYNVAVKKVSWNAGMKPEAFAPPK